MSTNIEYLRFRDWWYQSTYFPSRAFASLREHYRYCFRSQTSVGHNHILSFRAACDARKPLLSTTMRERYYDGFRHLRQLRRIEQGKDIHPVPKNKQRVQCDVCDTYEDIGMEINERTLRIQDGI